MANGQYIFSPRLDMGLDLRKVELELTQVVERYSRTLTSPASEEDFVDSLKFYFGQELQYAAQPSVAGEFFDKLLPIQQTIVYWAELDELRRQSKGITFILASRSLWNALQALDDPVVTALHLRQAIEATWWGLFLAYGANVGFSIVRRVCEAPENQHKYITVTSKAVEDFLRGWFAPSSARVQAGLDLGATQRRPDWSDDMVDENNVQLKKMREISRFWVTQISGEKNAKFKAAGLLRHLDACESAYACLSAWTHVSPILILHSVGQEQVPTPSPEELFRTVLISTAQLIETCLLDARWSDLSYLKAIPSAISQDAKAGMEIQIPELDTMRHKNKPVEVDLADGTKIKPYPRGR